jgi:hypothetical protein
LDRSALAPSRDLPATARFSDSRSLPTPTRDAPANAVKITVIVVDAVVVTVVAAFIVLYIIKHRDGIEDDTILGASLLGNDREGQGIVF